MRQAIITKYLGATNYKGSRIKAKADAGSITIGWDDSLGIDENHAKAAKALGEKFGWTGRYLAGGLPDNTGNCFVYACRAETFIAEVVAEEIFELREELSSLRREADEVKNLLGITIEDNLIDGVKELLDDAGTNDGETLFEVIERIGSERNENAEYEERCAEIETELEELKTAFSAALEDRKALLAKLGLSDAQWSAQGGHCEQDMELSPISREVG